MSDMAIFLVACVFLGFFLLATAGMPLREILAVLAVLALAILVVWIFAEANPSATLPRTIGGER